MSGVTSKGNTDSLFLMQKQMLSKSYTGSNVWHEIRRHVAQLHPMYMIYPFSFPDYLTCNRHSFGTMHNTSCSQFLSSISFTVPTWPVFHVAACLRMSYQFPEMTPCNKLWKRKISVTLRHLGSRYSVSQNRLIMKTKNLILFSSANSRGKNVLCNNHLHALTH